MDDLLNKISQIAGLSEEEKQKVIANFYKNLALLMVDTLSTIDLESANQLSELLKDISPNSSDKLRLFMSDMLKRPEVSVVVNDNIYRYTSDFASKMLDSSSVQQRQQIQEFVEQYKSSHKTL